MHGFSRHVGVQQSGAQTRFGFAVRLHDGLYFGQQLWMLVFCLRLGSAGDVVDASYSGLIFMDAYFYGAPIRGSKPEPPKIPSPQLQLASFWMRSAKRPNASFTYSNPLGSAPCARRALLKFSRSESHCRCSLSSSLTCD